MRIYYLLVLILLNGCAMSGEDLCSTFIKDYPIQYTTTADFNGCLLANAEGDMVLITKDSIQPEIHPENGSYSSPEAFIKKDELLIYYFNPVHDRKIFTVTGKRGFPKENYQVKVNDEWITYSLEDDKLKNYSSKIKFLQPQWHLLENDSLINSKDSYEFSFSGINVAFYSYLHNDSLFMQLKVVNHGTGLLHVFPPSGLTNNTVVLSDKFEVLKKGERLNKKLCVPFKGQPPIFIKKGVVSIAKDENSNNLLLQPVRLKLDTTEIF